MIDRPNIIIVKKKKIMAAAHHGGSWKVAYADFVTAMMAFFMVMWIMNMDEGVKELVEGYFSNPVGFKKSFSGGRNILSQGNSLMSMEVRDNFIIKRREEEQELRQAAEAIESALVDGGLAEGANAVVEVVVTDQGLRIEMMETGEGETFFDKSSAELKPQLRTVLSVIASHIAELPNGLIVEGHTDALPFGRDGYGNWELSVDRANSARRVLEAGGLPSDRLFEVRGYADRSLKFVEDALDPRNRRISLLLPFDTPYVEPIELDPETLARQLGAMGSVGGGG